MCLFAHPSISHDTSAGYRRIDAGQEEWIVDFNGTTVRIRLEAEPDATKAELAEAHAIVESMTYEPWNNGLGFRILFTLTNNEWDSG